MITIRQKADLSLAAQLKMKILHALVGYLAATALPFPSHPFAFASPLEAISNYDGYVPVNTSTLNSDGAVMKRGPGDIIEARQASIIIPAALLVVDLIVAVAASIIWVKHDDPVRGSGIIIVEVHFDY